MIISLTDLLWKLKFFCIFHMLTRPEWLITYTYTTNSENREHLRNFRNVDCVLANYSKVQEYASKRQNHKLITVVVCVLFISRLIG